MLDILVIENKRNVAKMAKVVLTRHGWKVAFHQEDQRGMDVIREVRPRMIILDLNTPSRSGAEILSELRKDGDLSLALTPVVMLTGNQDDADNAAQADAILPRPFVGRDLCALVSRMLPSGISSHHA
ncbi:response regulator [Paracoccus sp. 11-3]|uniref:Response regulator n=1 Tax=Paracoccus amoyensis TaxID=2760093 RepID=A0A926GAC4_9RHOB|nr:response regulator [Paracoccus amoyensis]MBC9245385.1 response regulator [Paracoccus amoyensis]